MLKIGFGYDVHPFAENRRLILGGVVINHPKGYGLLGHSDGDVFFHALIDSLLGMCGLGSIGEYFPESKEFENISSSILLEKTIDLINKRYIVKINNIDVVIISKSVNISSITGQIKNNTSCILNLEVSRINLKGKSGNGLGVGGNDQGIEVYCTILGEIDEI
ncbi:2C-methyl-D-erythritol 2,4-cyclodiphosphate synthase [Petrotoga mobilis SJ95]|uniref:2-C-methyl-D-erythritol 2,4-cyclodiphosphate synthase n=1 Tax=Petrotoga mobilis (strain DSM 10674 / SJ95) TaxID=403833 RepID=ISPF_PETMO|nr:2-C-methyl-D-erythritol 2,4-cyclodiphosphate synthase [Petrotoga mobilis]A9BHL8.1 RecName: Full=2-C-methyl-D-erythritol 2,4-cyclodiphosphate synthase; Short=MECDP-synthase; Short=MECPP-synthase; Short=MECPS [Petrotoga mobilis SJ95]ABX31890.1 2C-methyl-D-erythritol 2,4-cyclodiphosphate synthase [Petrotoga mobilis SJ95]